MQGSAAARLAPGPFCADVMIVLHFFSGRRREHDLQHYVEQIWADRFPPLLVVSLDVAISEAHGDLLRPGVISFWRQHVVEGRVLAGVAGPPCETWSAIRGECYEDGKEGPPAVRDAKHPWGLPTNKLRRNEQVLQASRLLQVALDFLTLAIMWGSTFVLEHPAYPYWKPTSSSIWALPELQALKAAPVVDIFRFRQSWHGQYTPKPTTLAAVRLPTLKSRLQTPSVAAAEIVQKSETGGKNTDGSWRTSRAKEYPANMNRILAEVICAAYGCAESRSASKIAEKELATVRAMVVTELQSAHAMRSDYYRCRS